MASIMEKEVKIFLKLTTNIVLKINQQKLSTIRDEFLPLKLQLFISDISFANMKKLLLLLVFTFAVQLIYGQEMPDTPEEYEKQYNMNIRKSRINGVYIPENMGDAIDEIKRLSPPDALVKFQNAPEDVVVKKLHFGLGRWMAVNWNFDEGSRFSHYLRKMGVTYTDDMITFTLRSLHRALNDIPLEMKERALAISEKRKQEYLDKINNGEVLDSNLVRKN